MATIIVWEKYKFIWFDQRQITHFGRFLCKWIRPSHRLHCPHSLYLHLQITFNGFRGFQRLPQSPSTSCYDCFPCPGRISRYFSRRQDSRHYPSFLPVWALNPPVVFAVQEPYPPSVLMVQFPVEFSPSPSFPSKSNCSSAYRAPNFFFNQTSDLFRPIHPWQLNIRAPIVHLNKN